MKEQSKWFFVLASMVGAWEESGENPAIFCYLIIWAAVAIFRERARTLRPAFVRLAACSRPSATFFTRFIPPTASEN